jgi:hypothetical protein
VLVYGFSENHYFMEKTDRNSIFLYHDPHIPHRLYIRFLYTSFYKFLKFSNFRSKFIGVSLRFYRKSQVWRKNWPKLHISWSWPPYFGSVIHNGPAMSFYRFWRNSYFCSKSIGVSLRFYRKSPVWGKNW